MALEEGWGDLSVPTLLSLFLLPLLAPSSSPPPCSTLPVPPPCVYPPIPPSCGIPNTYPLSHLSHLSPELVGHRQAPRGAHRFPSPQPCPTCSWGSPAGPSLSVHGAWGCSQPKLHWEGPPVPAPLGHLSLSLSFKGKMIKLQQNTQVEQAGLGLGRCSHEMGNGKC